MLAIVNSSLRNCLDRLPGETITSSTRLWNLCQLRPIEELEMLSIVILGISHVRLPVRWDGRTPKAVSADRSGLRVEQISRTSCAQRHAAAILAAHTSASSREGTSMIENPPITAFFSGTGPT